MLINEEMLERTRKLVYGLKQASKDASPLVDFARGPHNDLNMLAKRLGHEVTDAFERAEEFLELYERRLKLEDARRGSG